MASRQCMLAMELEHIEREKFHGSLAKRQIRQYFPRQKIVLYGILLNYALFPKHAWFYSQLQQAQISCEI